METRKVSWIKQGGADRKQRSSNNGEETGGSKLRIPEGGERNRNLKIDHGSPQLKFA